MDKKAKNQPTNLLKQILAELKKLNEMVVLLGEALLNRKIVKLKAHREVLKGKKGE